MKKNYDIDKQKEGVYRRNENSEYGIPNAPTPKNNKNSRYEPRPQLNTPQMVQWTRTVFNLGPTPHIKSLSQGSETVQRIQQMQDKYAGLASGRYLHERNIIFKRNYIRALKQLPKNDELDEMIKKLRSLPPDSMYYLADLLPNLNEWYPDLKAGVVMVNGKPIINENKEKLTVDIDYYTKSIMSGIRDTLNLIGNDKIITEKPEVEKKYVSPTVELETEYKGKWRK